MQQNQRYHTSDITCFIYQILRISLWSHKGFLQLTSHTVCSSTPQHLQTDSGVSSYLFKKCRLKKKVGKWCAVGSHQNE